MADILIKSFTTILSQFGRNILLQRRIANAVAPSAGMFAVPGGDEKNDYINKLEKWTTYSTFAGRKVMLASAQDEMAEGLVRTLKLIFYFQAEANPGNGDRIYDEDPRYQPLTYIIEYARPVRGHRGEIVYWECGTINEFVN